MRILTWNAFGLPFLPGRSDRLDDIRNSMLQEKVKVAGLQEVLFGADVKQLSTTNGYRAFHHPGMIFTKGALVSVIEENFLPQEPKTEMHTYTKQGRWWRHPEQFFDRVARKGFQVSELYNQELGNFVFVNTHLLCPSPEGNYQDPHLQSQLAQLLEYVGQRVQQKENVVLVGDLNFTRETPLYGQLTQRLQDCTPEAPGVDYILASEGIRCQEWDIFLIPLILENEVFSIPVITPELLLISPLCKTQCL